MDNDKKDSKFLKSLTLLYVEDEADAREQLGQFLQHLVGKLVIAKDGEEGLDAFHKYNPDIIITDIRMPTKDGLVMASEIRSYNSSVPIIVLTGFVETDYMMKAIDIGVVKYVKKPIDAISFQKILLEIAQRLRTKYNKVMEKKKHLLPTLEEVSQTSIDFYAKNQANTMLIMNDFLLKYLNTLYAEFNGDIILAIILGELAHQNISLIFHNEKITPEFAYKNLDITSLRDILLPSNPFAISEATGIPRETVRRKFTELVSLGWVKSVNNRGYVITPMVPKRFSFDFNLRIFHEARNLYSHLQTMLNDVNTADAKNSKSSGR